MAEFKDVQNQIQQHRRAKEAAKTAVLLSNEKLGKLQREIQRVSRSADQGSDVLEALEQREKDAKKLRTSSTTHLKNTLTAEQDLLKLFEPFTDPRKNIGQFSDGFPLLMFPVRIETRFKKIQVPGALLQHQLWVRVFPDDCSITAFEETLSETEVERVRTYWTNVWIAGSATNEAVEAFVENKAKGAWRELMGQFSPGRAYWIKENHKPENPGDIPSRNSETDLILVIPTEELPDQPTSDALSVYWRSLFLANGDAEKINLAFTGLVAALGGIEETAREAIEKYVPANVETEFDAAAPPDISVAVIKFQKVDDIDTQLASWSRASRVATLPERFVLLGYDHSEPAEAEDSDAARQPIINEIGGMIPDPLIVGPDPSVDSGELIRAALVEQFPTLSEDEIDQKLAELTDDDKAELYIEYLSGKSETKWMFDFEEAVRIGMGFKVNISKTTHDRGLSRIYVLGVKLGADEIEGKSLLEQLIKQHHFSDSGFSILPQGTPTNNTEDGKSGFSVIEDPGDEHARYYTDSVQDDPLEESEKRDGRWLADLLGIDIEASTLNLVSGYFNRDQCEARAMNVALWSATIGYFMESMLTPVFSEQQRELTRWFFVNNVSGRGPIPPIQIAKQPYGILPITTVSNLGWVKKPRRTSLTSVAQFSFFQQLYSILILVWNEWESLLQNVAYVGKKGGDPHEILLEALGLHPNSVEFDQRYAESFDHVYNRLSAQGFGGAIQAEIIKQLYVPMGMKLLADLGYEHNFDFDPKIPILEKYFLTKENDVQKPVVDDRELSETDPIRSYTPEGWNYVEWLIENAENNHRNIRQQKGFTENRRPYALLYDMLRHSLNLQFGNTGLNLYRFAGVLDNVQISQARVEPSFVGIQQQVDQLDSKWDIIYRNDDQIAGGGTMVVDHISSLLKSNVVNSQTRHLHQIVTALKHLKDTPTARLERVFVEHLDTCTYRIDSWLLGFVNHQLRQMRSGGTSTSDEPKKGIYLGAFGWLENIKAENKSFEDASLSPELMEIFDPDDELEPKVDSTNAGYVHAPSVNHALTAAVLRNAYISNASEDMAEPYKVNISSERVRMALEITEGMQQGQSLGALLGYQLERGLHDRTDLELDIYIYELRKMFPLGSNRMVPTEIKVGKVATSALQSLRFAEEENEFTEDKAVTKIEARNVVDGLALLDHTSKPGQENYPFGFPTGDGADKLKPANANIRDAIDSEVNRLKNIRDAVADLAMAESVHQVVQGNYDRASGALDAYSKGHYPQFPDIARSPQSGVGLTHRFGVHLPPGVVPGAGDTPRAKAEPAVSKWLEDIFPSDLSKIACTVEYSIPSYEDTPNPTSTKTISMSDLGLMPIDLLYMLNVESDKSLTALDDHILRVLHDPTGPDPPRPDVEVQIKYATLFDLDADGVFDPDNHLLTFFELASLIASLRAVLISSRPLRATDIALPNESAEDHQTSSVIDPGRVNDANQDLKTAASDLKSDVVDKLGPRIDDEDFEVTLGNKNLIMNEIDAIAGDYVQHLSALSKYGIPQAGFGVFYDQRAAVFSSVYRKLVEYKKRWVAKQAEFDELIVNQFPGAPDDEAKVALLQEAERTISTQATIPAQPINTYLATVNGKKANFDLKLGEIQTFLDAKILNLKAFFEAANNLIANLGDFDLVTLDFDDEERRALVLAEDVYDQSAKLFDSLKKKTDRVKDLIADEQAAAEPDKKLELLTEAAETIFGEDFTIVPEFSLAPDQGAELQKVFADKDKLLNYQATTKQNDFPVDEWLYGTARVREKLAAWENIVVLAEGLKDRPPMELTPFQLPHIEDDTWLGLEYPADLEIPSDKLLYTAHMPGFDATKPQCGLLADEWTEVIPPKKETTGLTFHYDRPNSEPPQTLLLMTPPEFTGSWKWQDLIDILDQTLQLAQVRAIEPDHVDTTRYAPFLPATVAAVTTHPLTMALNYAFLADQSFSANGDDDV